MSLKQTYKKKWKNIDKKKETIKRWKINKTRLNNTKKKLT